VLAPSDSNCVVCPLLCQTQTPCDCVCNFYECVMPIVSCQEPCSGTLILLLGTPADTAHLITPIRLLPANYKEVALTSPTN
jgi:hypothetical protein